MPKTELDAMREEKDNAYLERNRLVAFLTRIFPSGKGRTDIPGWSEDWHGCVYIDTPLGQLSWHYHDEPTQVAALAYAIRAAGEG